MTEKDINNTFKKIEFNSHLKSNMKLNKKILSRSLTKDKNDVLKRKKMKSVEKKFKLNNSIDENIEYLDASETI